MAMITFGRASAVAAVVIVCLLGEPPGTTHVRSAAQVATDHNVEAIIVTGTRLAWRDYEPASPVATSDSSLSERS